MDSDRSGKKPRVGAEGLALSFSKFNKPFQFARTWFELTIFVVDAAGALNPTEIGTQTVDLRLCFEDETLPDPPKNLLFIDASTPPYLTNGRASVRVMIMG